MKCKDCGNETEEIELEIFDGRCISCNIDTMVDWVLTKSSFIVPLKMWGNSYVLKVPPQIAKLYSLDQELQVTLESVKNNNQSVFETSTSKGIN